MQQLKFEASWDKALADQDRKQIEKIFNKTKDQTSSDILCSPIREAINHKEELLVSVIVHNFTEHSFSFNNIRLLYRIQGEVIADKAFTLVKLEIPPYVSMPWTFIFQKKSYTQKVPFKNGRLELSYID